MSNGVSSPILVVGAGPVGLVLATDLARRGVPVRIIDELPQPTTESRAIVIHARSLEQLEVLGVAEPLLASGIRTTGVEFHADGKRLAHVPLDTVDSRYPFSLTIAQTETERILTERLAELGVRVERGLTFVGLEQDDATVRATIRRADGTTETIVAPWLAGTEGAHGDVRHATGQTLEGGFKGERFLMGDVDADFAYDRGSFHIFFSAKGGTGLLFPMAGRRVRAFAQLAEGVDVDRAPSVEWMKEALAARGIELAIGAPRWLTQFEIHHAQVPRYRVGRVFLAGDSAHVHSPAGGQGMNTGMQDALNLSWKLALAWRGRAKEALLDSYHAERHPVAAHVIAFTTKLTTAGTVHRSALRHLRNAALQTAFSLTPAQHAVANEIEELRVDYRESPVVVEGRAAVKAGDFVPGAAAALVAAALRSRVVAEASAHLGLVLPGPDGVPAQDDLPAGVVPVALGDAAPDLRERSGLGRAGGVLLVRPDGYVGAVAPGRDVDDAVTRYLARIGGA